MAIKTRNLKQWLVYELVEVVAHPIDQNGGKREDLVPVAMFDDQDLLNEYLKGDKYAGGSISWSIREEWANIKPEASNFSLPLNPIYSDEK